MQSVSAIFAGFITVPILGLICGLFLRAYVPHGFTGTIGTPYATVSVLLSQIGNAAGGFLTAALAPNRRLLHASVMGLLSLAVGIWVAIADWNQAPGWYHLAEIGLLLPMTLVGGWLAAKGRTNAH